MNKGLNVFLSVVLIFSFGAANSEKPAPHSSNPKAQNVYRFAGFSSQLTSGVYGINNIYRVCQEDMDDPLARMCTSEEFMASPNVASIDSSGLRDAFLIHPKIVAQINGLYVDYSGYTSEQNLSCVGWGRPASALVVAFWNESQVTFWERNCADFLPVTCCTPQ